MTYKLIFCLFLLICVQIVVAQYHIDRLPIEPSRTISFDTDEGSNMDVDISADGKTIVFTMLGEIFTLSVKGGVATQITRGIAVNQKPVWSPDGKMIACLSDASGAKRLQVMHADGTHPRIFNDRYIPSDQEPVWDLRGTAIIGDNSIYHLAGGSVSLPGNISTVLNVSTDGNRVFCYKNDIEDSVYQYDRRTGIKSTLFTYERQKDGEHNNMRISPDGRWLCYIPGSMWESADSLMIHDLHSGQTKLLVNLNIPYPGLIGYQRYALSSDSKKVYIGYGGKIHEIDIETGENVIVPFTAHVNIDLGPLNDHTFRVLQDSLQVNYTRDAHRSPDGKQLVFSALNRIYLQDLPGGKPRMLVYQDMHQYHPAYSPDGKWIAYVTWQDNAGGQLWSMSTKGGKAKQLTKIPGLYTHPSWSPDGKSIVVGMGAPVLARRDFPGQGKVVVITVNNGAEQVMADSVCLFNRSVFSSDGKGVMYDPAGFDHSTMDHSTLVLKLLDGTFARVIAEAIKDVAADPIRDVLLSPDNRYVVYMFQDNLHLVPAASIYRPLLLHDDNSALPIIRFAKGGFDPHWEENGKILSWSYGNKYFRINPDKIIAEAIKNAKFNKEKPEIIDVDIITDQAIVIDLKVPRNVGGGIIALKNARIISMKGEEIIEKGTILINNGKFHQVGPADEINIPLNAKVMDLSGKTIIPGLVDMHCHMSLPPDVFPQQSWMYLSNLSYGVTTARDPSGSYDFFGYEELLQTGQMIGPRLFNVGNAVRPGNYSISNMNEAGLVAQNRLKMRAIYIKQYMLDTRLQREWLLMASNQAGINMTNEGSRAVPEDIEMLKDGSTGIEHDPNWGDTYKDVITLFSKAGTYLTPALQQSYSSNIITDAPKLYFRNRYLTQPNEKYEKFTPVGTREKSLPPNKFAGFHLADYKLLTANNIDSVAPRVVDESKILATLRKNGLKITTGSHGEDKGIGEHFEIWALQMGGITNHEALQSATIIGAEALGMQQDIGSIEPGKIADLIVLDKNPLEDIHNTTSIQYVMKDGILYDGNTLDQLWPTFKKLPEWRMPVVAH